MPGTLSTLRRAASDPGMRRLQFASAGWAAGEAAYLVGLFVLAYEAGGAGLIAAIAVIRTLPSVLLAPTMSALVSDRAVDASLRATLLVRVVCVAALAATLVAVAPFVVVGILVAIDSIAATLLRPLRGAALPAVARSPGELVAGNVALTTGDSLANLVGPALAAVALVIGGPLATFVPGLGLLVASLASALGLHAGRPAEARPTSTARQRSTDGTAAEGDAPDPPRERLVGPRWLARSPARWIVGMFVVQRFVRGAMTVLVVAAAIDLLGMGDAGVGVLTAAMGLGGVIGGLVAVALVGRERLAPGFVAGLVVWGVGIAVVGAAPLEVVAIAALAIGGIGKVLIDVAGYTLLQRTVPNAMRTRVLGLQEGLVTAALAAGSILASVLIDALGVAGALIVAGSLPALAAVGAWPLLRRAEAAAVVPSREIDLLRGVPMFEPLPLATIEDLASSLGWLSVEPGSRIIVAGEPGDRFYIVDDGAVDIAADDRAPSRLERGGSFGEIALLRDVPRTATVTAVGPVRLAFLERERFIAAVTGHRASAAAADDVVRGHLGHLGRP
jgi:hypothetical protein